MKPTVAEGETRRVVLLRGEELEGDVIAEFGEIDRPGLTHWAVIFRGQVPSGISVGDECTIQYRAQRGRVPDRWIFIRRCVEVPSEQLAGA